MIPTTLTGFSKIQDNKSYRQFVDGLQGSYLVAPLLVSLEVVSFIFILAGSKLLVLHIV